MPRPQTFSRPVNVVLDAAGYGHVAITCPSGVVWQVLRVSASTNAPPVVPGTGPVTVQPIFTVYADNKPNPAAFIADSYSGNKTTARADETLMPGQSLCAEWRGIPAHAGLIGTMTIAGNYFQGS